MAIKDLAYTIKRQLESATHKSFRHTHVYELLAASLGFNSSAAMSVSHVLVVLQQEPEPATPTLAVLQARLVELGYRDVANTAGTTLLQIIRNQRLGVVAIESVIRVLGDSQWTHEDDSYRDEEDEGEGPGFNVDLGPAIDLERTEMLLEGLTSAARRGSAAAHYALAHIYEEDDSPDSEGSEHWYSLLKQGRELQGIELEWALAYGEGKGRAERYGFHFAEAARLGHRDARLAFAIEGAHQAESEDDFDSAKRCYLEAAALGDIDAMRSLIEEYDQANLMQSWVWVYLSELLGDDLRNSSLRAYHEGGLYAGEEYDDDQGGPMYVAGHEGVELDPLSAADDAEARRLARMYFRRIDPTGR